MSNPLVKINVLPIFKDHFYTLRNYGKEKVSKLDSFLFFFFPLLISAVLYYFNIHLTNSFANILITVFSIFAGLLFNLQILMFDAIGKVSSAEMLPEIFASQQSLNVRISLLETISLNVSFEILLCLSGVLILAASTLFKNMVAQAIFSVISFYIIIVFSVTLAMVLKRVHALLKNEIAIQKGILKNRANR